MRTDTETAMRPEGCRCDFRTYMVGDGCFACRPTRATPDYTYTPARQESAAKRVAAQRKLSDEQVREIRAELERSGRGAGKRLAITYGVNEGTISRIKSGKHWKGVCDE